MTQKHVEENTRRNRTPIDLEIRVTINNCIKLKTFCTSKETITRKGR
jgi:hypothetical protein